MSDLDKQILASQVPHGFTAFLRDLPTWFILLALFLVLLAGYYIRPDSLTEDALKGVMGALLAQLVPPRIIPPAQPTQPT